MPKFNRSLTVGFLAVLVLLLVFFGWNMQRKELIQVELNFSGSRCGTLTVYSDYSCRLNCSDPLLKERVSQAIARVIAEDNALLRYEDMENGVLVMKGEYLSRKDKDFVHALLISVAEKVNSEYKEGFFSFSPKPR